MQMNAATRRSLALVLGALLSATCLGGGEFTVATFNVRCPAGVDRGELAWYRRLPRVAEVVRSHGFDVFGVQEAVPAEAMILDAELPGFARVGCGRDKDRGGEAMYVYYRKKRFQCLEDGTFWLSETPDEPGSRYAGAGCPRTCTWALLLDKETGRRFRFFNTHLDHLSSQARLDGMSVLLERGVRPAKARGETVFLTGDLNETLDGADSPETIRSLSGPTLAERGKVNPIALASTELSDTYAMSKTPHKGPHKTFHGFKGTPLCRIDYVFATPDVEVLSHATLDDRPGGEYASDHYPVSATVSIPKAAAECRLPGEDGTREALPCAPFPDRLSAYVWRNWGLVDAALLAETVGASKGEICAVAEDMGLEPDPAVLPEWKKKGYITILRRNWHLLPYDQLMKLVGKTRSELYFCLMEDDFLWVKLGGVKPKCDRLVYDAAAVGRTRPERRRIAAALGEEGLDPAAPEEPRFKFVKEISAVSGAAAAPGSPDLSPFDFRLIFSYFADFGNPLGDPEVSSYPDGLLQKLAAEGVNAVWLHTVLRTLAKDPKYPEFGEGSEERIANLRTLVARAAKYGIKVYLYMNEPRAMPKEFFEANEERKGFMGAPWGGRYAMCTSSPEVRRWVRDSLRQVFSQVPGLGGIFTITMSENLTNCASRKKREMCPRCRGRKTGEIVAEINSAMVEGMAAGNPDAEALIWNWAWPEDEEAEIVAALPRHNCRLMAVSENSMKIRRGGVEVVERDYSMSIVGPGDNARRLWGFAKNCGIPSVAKVQAGNTWELSSFPYIPVMDLVAQHAVNLANEGVGGVMLSWSLGCCPSPNLRVYRELRRGETDKEGVLDRMASAMYGANAKRARAAWKAFSDGFVNYPFSCSTIYVGPHQWGPANPLYLEKTGWKATMVGIPYDDLDGWRSNYPRETYAQLIGKVADGFAEGCRLMDGVASGRELDMYRAEQMHFASCRDQARFVMARDKGDAAAMVRFAKAELERAKEYWRLVRADSRIGYESSNHYFFVPRDVLEKVLSCRAAISACEARAGAD